MKNILIQRSLNWNAYLGSFHGGLRGRPLMTLVIFLHASKVSIFTFKMCPLKDPGYYWILTHYSSTDVSCLLASDSLLKEWYKNYIEWLQIILQISEKSSIIQKLLSMISITCGPLLLIFNNTSTIRDWDLKQLNIPGLSYLF